MNSIPPEQLASIVIAAAVESRRPWRVEDLRTEAQRAYRAVMQQAATSGLSSEQASALVRGRIHEQVKQAGEKMDALPPGQKMPTSEQLESALNAFTVEQWLTLIDDLDQMSVQALLSHVRQHAGELKQKHGERFVGRVEGRAIMRDTALWLAENRDRLMCISDPYWADFWRGLARQANLEGKGRTATGRSGAEQVSDRRLAERLSKRDVPTDRVMRVSRYEVKRWRERMERLPYEQYAANVGADDEGKRAAAFIDYYTMIRKKYQREN